MGDITRKQKEAHAKRQRKVRARKKQQFEEMKRKLAVYEDFRNWEYKEIDGRIVGVFLAEKPKTKNQKPKTKARESLEKIKDN
jgi:hypothetical protein